MREIFARWPLARRIVALAAAYAIALSGLIGSIGATRAAVADIVSPGVVICHSTLPGQTAPAGNGKSDCDNSCCLGCVLLLAAVPPPPMTSVAMALTQGHRLPAPATVALPFDPQVRSHQSRAPPLAA